MSVRRFAVSAVLAGVVTLTYPAFAPAHPTDPLDAAPKAPAAGAKLEATSGVVRELLIEDHVAGMTVRHLSMAPSAGGSPVALVGPQVQTLVGGQGVTVTGRRNGNTLFVDGIQANKATRSVAAENEHVEGVLAVAHIDDFETGKTGYVYEVRGDQGVVTGLDLGVAPEALQAGMRVRAHGNRAAASDQLEPSRIEILALSTSPTATSSTTTTTTGTVSAKTTTYHKVLVVAVKFTDTASDPVTIASLQSLMVSASDSVSNFFREASYSQHQLTVTIPSSWLRATIATPTSCNYSAISTAGDAAAKAAGYDPSLYEFKVYMFPRVSSCGWSGLGYVGFPRLAYINGPTSFQTKVIGHEMGHNFGLLHAASLDCGAVSIGGTCTVSEYGDPFNTMGNMTSMHYAAAQKSLLGWIPSTSVKTHTSGSATYVINPLETAGGSVYAVKVPAASNRTYWLEYRQPIGFDAGLSSYPTNGVQIRVSSPFETLSSSGSGSDDTELLDFTTGTTPFTDAALTVGKSYTDSKYGYTFNVIGATATGVTVQVSAPGSTGPKATSTALASSANPSTWQAAVTFTATVSGTSPTGTVSFYDGASAISGCSAVALAGSGNVRTATCATAALVVGSHSMTAKYSGDAGNLTSTSSALGQSITSAVTSSNVALASAGAVASASSTMQSYNVAWVIDGDLASRWWTDANNNVFPDWVQVDFAGSKTIDRVVVYSQQDNYTNPVTPTDTMTFTSRGITDFSVQAWNGTSWVTLATVAGNNLVKRTVTFAAYKTSKIRISITKCLSGWSRMVELQAWGT